MKTSEKKQCVSQKYISDLMSMREAKHRPNTQGVNHALLHHLIGFYGDTPRLADITEEFCIEFAKFLMARVAMGSVRTYLQKMHAILEYAVAARLIAANPMPSIRTLMPGCKRAQRVYLTQNEVARLSATPCGHEETKRAFLFACQTGLRLSDIETLVWEDIADIEGKPTIVKVQVKTGREVSVPLNAVALSLLGERRRAGKVFGLRSRSVIAADLQRWAQEAGVGKHLTFHVSRHTFATLSISAGVDIYVVSRLCGHTTVRTTEIYAHIIDKTLQHGVELLGNAMMGGSTDGGGKVRASFRDRLRRSLLPLFRCFLSCFL